MGSRSTIAPGETLGLVGESGSGKSATSLALLRLLPPSAAISGGIEVRRADGVVEELLSVAAKRRCGGIAGSRLR